MTRATTLLSQINLHTEAGTFPLTRRNFKLTALFLFGVLKSTYFEAFCDDILNALNICINFVSTYLEKEVFHCILATAEIRWDLS